jgi:hypothetical protein
MIDIGRREPFPRVSLHGSSIMMTVERATIDVNDAPQFGPGDLAESRLRGNPYFALKSISCDYRAGDLILRGRVPTYYLKQVASAIVAGLPGVQRIVNQIDVGAPPARG